MAFAYRSARNQGLSITPGLKTYASPQARQISYAPFSTTAKRTGLAIASGSASPGPGAYNLLTPARAKQPPPVYRVAKGARNSSVPSIPSAFQKYGFEETSTGELVMQASPAKNFTGEKRDSVGPGHYNVQPRFRSQGPAWHKSKVERVLRLVKPGPGPGAYSDSLLKSTTKKFTVAFSSNVQRDSYIPPAGKSSDSESEEEGDATPGPGHYFAGALPAAEVRPSHQFLSRVPRFQLPIDESPHLGPGYYGKPREAQNKRKEVPFASSNKRFIDYPETTPGPGAYTESQAEPKLAMKEWVSTGAFGTTDKRFHPPLQEETPGPGYYRFRTPKKRGPTSSFLSTDKRLADSSKQGAPPPGAYEVPSTIGLRRKNLGTQPLLMHLDSPKKPVGFESQAERFVGAKAEGVGPGTYNPQDSPSQGNSSLPRAERFLATTVQNPGPGTYEHLADWNKKSFNLLFSDAL